MSASRPPQTAPALSPAELELKSMWQDAELEFSQLTRPSRSLRTDREKRLEDVLAELDRKYRPPEDGDKASAAKARAKIRTTIGQVLSCIQLLGGLAAQGASIVFGPATLCFNAISFLIDIPGRVASVYEGVGNLFEEISHFLVLFKIYENYTTLDPSLRDGTHKLMVSLVRICGLSIRIIEGGVLHHIKIGAKITFLNDDSGVRAELTKFKALIDKQSHVTEAVTLQHVLSSEGKIVEVLNAHYENAEKLTNLEGNMSIVVADVNDRKMQMIVSERVEQIAKMLSMTKEPAEDARRSMQKMRDNLLAGSGQWLLDHEDYEEWKTTKSDAIPLLLLSGDAKTGKSSLLAAIEGNIRKNNNDVAVAYYEFVGRDAKILRDKNEVLVLALKSMALQIAGQYKLYAREMAAQRDDFKPPEAGKEKDSVEKLWWDKLHFSRFSRIKEDANVILIFDGLEELSDSNRTGFLKFLKTITARSSAKAVQQHVRIIATGAPKVFENTLLAPIAISESNMADIKLYIEEELKTTESLQGQHVEMLDLLEAIQETLPEVARGSFSTVQQKLERIKEAVDSDAYLDDVETILREDPAEDSGKLAWKILSDLNATLNAHEIDQLNKLLHWCVFGFGPFDIDELRATVYLSSGKSTLQPFETKLRKKYAKLFTIEGDRVYMEDDIDELFRFGHPISKNDAKADLENARISMTVSINQADSRSVQQFFWDLTERVGIGRFDFLNESNLDRDGKGVIHTEMGQAHLHITEQLLKLLNDELNEKTNCLVRYALRQLPWHLRELHLSLKDGKLEDEQRRNIGKGVVDLLSDAEGIGKFLDAKCRLPSDWLEPDEAVIFRDWLTDKRVIDVLQPKERRWVKLHTADSEGNSGIFKPTTLAVARRWLRDRDWPAWKTYVWIQSYIGLQNMKHDTFDQLSEIHAPDKIVPPPETHMTPEPVPSAEDEILSAAQWVQRELALGDVNLDTLWFERLADTCYGALDFAAAIKYYEKAKGLPGSQWTIDEGWAKAVFDNTVGPKDLANKRVLRSQACDRLQKLVENLRALSKTVDATADVQEALVRNLKRLAEWQEVLEMVDHTIALYEEVVEIDPGDHATRGELLKALYKQKHEMRARDMLTKIIDQKRSTADADLFPTLLRYLAENETFEYSVEPFHIILFLGQTDEIFNSQVIEGFQTAIADTRRSNLTALEGTLLLFQGVGLTRGTTDETRIQQGIRCWEDCQSLYLESRYDLLDIRISAARFVAQHYFQRAIDPGGNAEERESNLKQLLRINRPTAMYLASFRPTSYIAAYYVRLGQPEEARKLFRDEMVTALEILSDGDPDNDTYGYKTLSNILLYTGDDLNALSSWSLLGPEDIFSTNDQEPASDITKSSDEEQEAATDNHFDDKEVNENGTLEGAVQTDLVSSNLSENGLPLISAEVTKNVISTGDGVPEAASDNNNNNNNNNTDRNPQDIGEPQNEDESDDAVYRSGPLAYWCDGFCGHIWWFADDMYICRYCQDLQFCASCVQKLKANKLERYICHPEHSLLHVQAWSDAEALEVGRGNIRVHGQLVDGKRVGGDVVEIGQWLDELREVWEIPKSEPVIELMQVKRTEPTGRDI